MAVSKDYVESTGQNLALRSSFDRVGGQSLLAAPVRFFRDRLWGPFRDSISEAYQRQYYPLGYSAGLDGLRGLMTLGVIAAHVNFGSMPGSVIFIDIFYVMSGYFITGLLIKDVKRHGRVHFFQFYSRRFCRLVPPLAAMIVGFLVFSYLYFPDFRKPAIDAAIGFFYIANWWRAFDWPGIAYMGHTWSLAVEEQFYLLWPLTFLILFRCLGLGWRMVVAILTIALAIWAWRFWMTWHGVPFKRLYNGFDTRADALMVGSALAVVLAFVSLENRPTFDRILKLLAWPIPLVGLTFTFFFLDWQQPGYYYAGIVLVGAALGIMLVLILIRPLDTVLHRVLELSVLVFFGRIFYAMYLWHWPMVWIFWHDFGWPVWLRAVVTYPLTILLAVLSYVLIERHFMRTKGRSRAAKADQITPIAAPSVLPT